MSQAKSIYKQYLFISDFDQTLSFKDSGIVLSEMLGIQGFQERIAGLSPIHLVQQGGELAYLLLHDPEFRRVRREHLVEAGKRIRLKQNIRWLSQSLENLDGRKFAFDVVSAGPEELVQSALGNRAAGACFWNAVSLQRRYRRNRIDRARSRGLWQGRGARATARAIGHQP